MRGTLSGGTNLPAEELGMTRWCESKCSDTGEGAEKSLSNVSNSRKNIWDLKQDYSETSGSILILHGSVDPVSGMDDVTNLVKELNDFEIQHEVHIYGGVRHTFTIKGSRDYS